MILANSVKDWFPQLRAARVRADRQWRKANPNQQFG